MKKISLRAPAKINLTLEIIRRLLNGFHQIRSVVLKLNELSDKITLIFDKKIKGIEITSNSKHIPLDEKNIVHKIASAFFLKSRKKTGIKIHIQKNIPIGAGLGGGSSDGALILMALNKYFDYPFSQKELVKLAASIGKDIPIFLQKSNLVLMEGTGEKIKSLKHSPLKNILLVNPLIHISTPWAYGEFDKKTITRRQIKPENFSKKLLKNIHDKNKNEALQYLHNDFENITFKKFPRVKILKKTMIESGARGALMSGSGSTVFGIFNSKSEVLSARKKLAKKFPKFIMIET